MRYAWAAVVLVGLLAASVGVGGGYLIFNFQNTQSQLEEAKNQAKALQQIVGSLQDNEKKLVAERDNIEAKIVTVVDKLDAVNSSLSSNKKENQDLIVQVSDLKMQLQEVAAGLGVRIEEIKTSSKVRDVQILNATKQIEESKKMIEDLKKQIADMSKQIADLRNEAASPRDQQKPSATCTPGDTVFQEDFEYAADITNHGWIQLSTAGSAQTQPDIVAQGSRALRLNDQSSSASTVYARSISTLEGDFQIEFLLRTEQYGQSVVLQLWGNPTSVESRFAGIGVELSDNNRSFRVQDTYYFVHQLNKWYRVKLMVRPALQSFDVYVDDMNFPLAKNIKFLGTSFNRITMGTATGGTGSGYWDGIVIRNCADQQKVIATCSPGDIVFQDNFEFTDALTSHGWVSISTAGIAQTQTAIVAEGSRALRLDDLGNSVVNYYVHPLPILNGNFQVDYYTQTEQYGQTVALYLQGDQGVVDGRSKGIRVELSELNRNFFAQDMPQFVYQLNKWYHVRLIVKTPLQSFDIYVDDMDKPIMTNIKFLDTLFNRLALSTATAGTGPGYWDGISIKCLP